MSKLPKESYIPAPWGKIALISWGKPTGTPILLLHGEDTDASDFLSMLGLFPDDYYYVAMDLPGYGNSDPFPAGIHVIWFYFVVAMEVVVKHFQWKHFVCMGLTAGCKYGIHYCGVFPGRIQKIVHLKPGVPSERVQQQHKQKGSKNAEKQADIVFSRTLTEVAENHYFLFWKKQETPAPKNVSKNTPPRILIKGISGKGVENRNEAAKKPILGLKPTLANFISIEVECPHDMEAAQIMYTFLKEDYVPKSNL